MQLAAEFTQCHVQGLVSQAATLQDYNAVVRSIRAGGASGALSGAFSVGLNIPGTTIQKPDLTGLELSRLQG